MIGKTIAELAAGDRAEITRVVEEDDIAAFVARSRRGSSRPG
jgi:hypothetical protein